MGASRTQEFDSPTSNHSGAEAESGSQRRSEMPENVGSTPACPTIPQQQHSGFHRSQTPGQVRRSRMTTARTAPRIRLSNNRTPGEYGFEPLTRRPTPGEFSLRIHFHLTRQQGLAVLRSSDGRAFASYAKCHWFEPSQSRKGFPACQFSPRFNHLVAARPRAASPLKRVAAGSNPALPTLHRGVAQG